MHKKIFVTSPLMPKIEDYLEKVYDIWDSKWLTNNGKMCKTFQQRLKQLFGTKYVELYVNGHMALEIAVKALGLKGEVITTPFTFASTTHSLVLNGLTPVFCDIKENDYSIDEDKLEELITEDACAIMPVHVYGIPCNIEKIEEIAKKHNLKVIYDAAHAFGVKYKGKSIASYGDVSMFSLHATKVFNSIEGGVLSYNNDEWDESLTLLRNFGIYDAETVKEVGLNAKMNEFSAAMGLCNLDIIDDAIEKRKALTELYVDQLSDLAGLELIDYDKLLGRDVIYNYSYLPVKINKDECGFSRDDLFEHLQENSIYSRKYFYPLVVDYDCYCKDYGHYKLPVARKVANQILALPIYADLDAEDVIYCCEIIRKWYRHE